MSLFDKVDRLILRNIKVTHETTQLDHIELGTPGKLGVIKVYCDAKDPELFKKKIDNAITILEYANKRMYGDSSSKKAE